MDVALRYARDTGLPLGELEETVRAMTDAIAALPPGRRLASHDEIRALERQAAFTIAKRLDPGLKVTLFTEFPDIAYSPCGIPFVHGREIDKFESLFLSTVERPQIAVLIADEYVHTKQTKVGALAIEERAELRFGSGAAHRCDYKRRVCLKSRLVK